MTAREINDIYAQTIFALDNKELKTAFDSLQTFIAATRKHVFQDELNTMTEIYKNLLHYYVAGSKDPMQTEILAKLFRRTYEIADKIRHDTMLADSPYLYYATKRTFNIAPENIVKLTNSARLAYELTDLSNAETDVSQLFKKIWTADLLTDEDIACLRESFKYEASESVANKTVSIINCQIVSALILALICSFDKCRFMLLFDAAESRDEELKLRAFVGILVLLYLYRKRTEYYPDIAQRLDTLADTDNFRNIVYFIIRRFILSRDTEKISHKLQDEIIPEMMKLNPKFNPRISLKDFSIEKLEEGMNPEWMEKFVDSSLGKKIEEFNELQEEGADVMHSTFIHLKNYPFFREISNWFLPFTTMQSSINDSSRIVKSLELITQAGFMCNSDMYSLYFSMQNIPEAGRNIMMSQLEEQMNALKESRPELLRTRTGSTERIIGQYVQDIYRFCKLFPRRTEFTDIFNEKLDIHNLPIIQQYLSDKEDLINIAEYYLRKNYFEDALVVYNRLSDTDEMLYQKRGYCRQMTGDCRGALDDYSRAELMNADSKWLLRRMAQCYRTLKQSKQAIDYYLRCEKLDPENLSITLSIGSCYLEMKEYGEALKYYYKVDYTDKGAGKAWRPIAWCSFLTGKYDQARNYYKKILSANPDAQDFMNAGHTEWVLQNLKGAAAYYRLSIAAESNDFKKFRTQFNKDLPDLRNAGIEDAEVALMLDEIRF